MQDWVKMEEKRPPANALIVYYQPLRRYIWGCGSDYDQIKGEYPATTHWKVVTTDPVIEDAARPNWPPDWPKEPGAV